MLCDIIQKSVCVCEERGWWLRGLVIEGVLNIKRHALERKTLNQGCALDRGDTVCFERFCHHQTSVNLMRHRN